MFRDQKEKWIAESPLAREISAILAKHPEYYGEIQRKSAESFRSQEI